MVIYFPAWSSISLHGHLFPCMVVQGCLHGLEPLALLDAGGGRDGGGGEGDDGLPTVHLAVADGVPSPPRPRPPPGRVLGGVGARVAELVAAAEDEEKEDDHAAGGE
jgi:hypothetical protein